MSTEDTTRSADLNPVDHYARDVVEGRVPAGKYHRLACARHLRDRAREGTPGFPFRFEYARADRFFRFAEKLKHYKGKRFAGQPIRLQPYQRFRLGSVFAWVHVETGLRRFRTSYHEVPRKNGKSLEAAVVMLYLTFYDGEPGAEGYTIATKRDQAKLVFKDCRELVKSSGLKERITVRVSGLHRGPALLAPLGADHDSTDGLNPSAVCCDELHAYKDRGLLDVMETATGAREQPHIFKITTAGEDPVSPGGDEHDYACKILDGVLEDDSYFAFIAHADPEDDWLAESTWQKANPNWNVSINPDDMRALATKAKGMPAAAATFKQKRLNQWVNATAPWLSVEGWRQGQRAWLDTFDVDGGGYVVRLPMELEHESCFVGLDLSSKLDLCALVAVFPPTVGRGRWVVVPWVFTPEDTLTERARRDRAPYVQWVEQGHLFTMPGTSIDHNKLRPVLKALRERVDIEAIGFDPWHAGQLVKDLHHADGFAEGHLIEVSQTYAGMSAGGLAFEAEVLAGDVDAGGSPLMAWCAANAVVQRDGKDNIYPVKKKSRGRIDPIVAALIARSLAIKLRPEQAFTGVVKNLADFI